ncbi:hypothetical protein Tco_0783662 [Tanacetum coccineum]
MTTFMNWYCKKVNKTVLTQADFESQAYEVVKAFYLDVIHLQFQMEEFTRCSQLRLTGRIQKEIKSESMSTDHCLSVVLQQGKQSYTIDFQDEGLQNMASLTGGLIDRSSILTDMILHHVEKIKIVLRRADLQEHTIAKKDFKNMYPSEFEDLNLLLLQGHLDHLPGSDKRMLSTAVKLWTRNLTEKDVTRSKEFIAAIERRLKTRRIYRNLECFVGGRVRDIDYRLLQRTE